jgi:hypothetical protein
LFAIKAEIPDLTARTFKFVKAKTMYGGKTTAEGDTIFLCAGGNDGLIARDTVTSS